MTGWKVICGKSAAYRCLIVADGVIYRLIAIAVWVFFWLIWICIIEFRHISIEPLTVQLCVCMCVGVCAYMIACYFVNTSTLE